MTAKQTLIVTGGKQWPLALEAASALAESADQGWHVVIACRNPAKSARQSKD